MANQIDRRYGVSEGLAAKRACRAVATSNITLSSSQSIDGVSVTDGDRVLVTGQTAGADNGIYVVSSTAPWTRALDFDGALDICSGTLIFVVSGGSYSHTLWYVATADDITIGTTSITISPVSASVTGATQQKKTTSGSVTVATSDVLIAVNKTVGEATPVTLPLSASKLGAVKVADWKGDSLTNNITVSVSGSDKMNGNQTSAIIKTNGASLVFTPLSDGSGYAI